MAEQLMDGIGSGNLAIVDNSHRLWTTGSITSMPSIAISGMVNDWTLNLKQWIDYQDSQQPIYIGLALPGTGSEEAGWFIRKYILSGNPVALTTQVLFASGNTNFDKRWDQRSGIYEVYN